jgi:hypothetical protein
LAYLVTNLFDHLLDASESLALFHAAVAVLGLGAVPQLCEWLPKCGLNERAHSSFVEGLSRRLAHEPIVDGLSDDLIVGRPLFRRTNGLTADGEDEAAQRVDR